MSPVVPNDGDRVVFVRQDGFHDIENVKDGAVTSTGRQGIASAAQAREIARADLDGGRVLLRRHDSPDVFEVWN